MHTLTLPFPELADSPFSGTTSPPGNCSLAHWWLQWLVRDYLRQQQSSYCVALEVPVRGYDCKPGSGIERRCKRYAVLDVYAAQHLTRAELSPRRPAYPRTTGDPERDKALRDEWGERCASWSRLLADRESEYTTTAVEVKVSRADFRSGFTVEAAEFSYVATPPGMIEKSELPEHVGLLEYAPKNQLLISMKKRAERVEGAGPPPITAALMIASAMDSEMANRVQWAHGDPLRD